MKSIFIKLEDVKLEDSLIEPGWSLWLLLAQSSKRTTVLFIIHPKNLASVRNTVILN